MKGIIATLALAAATLGLTGCATLMRDAPSQQLTAPRAGTAKIVFMRTSFVAGAIGCDLFDVVNGELRLIGQIPMGSKVVYETTPGDKVIMAYGTAADFMTARLEAGKPTEATDGWMKENRTRMQDIYKDYWGRFQRKSASEKSDRQMNPADGQ